MMKKNKNIQLLKEYIRSSLNENEYGDIAAGFDSSAYNSGYSSGGEFDSLMKIFVQPATDVLKTVVGQAKEITTRGATILKVIVPAIVTTIIPFAKYDYQEIFDEEKVRIEKIRGEYSDVYARTSEALSGPDFAVLAFMSAPSACISHLAANKVPKVSKELLSTITGGSSDELFDKIKNINSEKEINSIFGSESETNKQKSKKQQDDADFDEQLKSFFKKRQKENQFLGTNSINEFDNLEEYQIVEDDESDSGKNKKKEDNSLDKKILTNKKFIEKALDNPRAKSMSAEATKIYQETLNNVFKQAEKTLKNTKTVEDLQKFSKKPIKGIEKLKKLQGNEKKKAEEALFKTIKSTMKDFYIKNLTDHYKEVINAGIPEDSQYVKDYKAVIEKIKSLS